MTSDSACSDCECIGVGDVVEHIMNTNVFGVVLGFMGSLVGIRVSPSLAIMWFHEWELRHLDGDEYDEPTGEAVPVADNVIDFTRARELRGNTPTKGAA